MYFSPFTVINQSWMRFSEVGQKFLNSLRPEPGSGPPAFPSIQPGFPAGQWLLQMFRCSSVPTRWVLSSLHSPRRLELLLITPDTRKPSKVSEVVRSQSGPVSGARLDFTSGTYKDILGMRQHDCRKHSQRFSRFCFFEHLMDDIILCFFSPLCF